MGVKSGLGHTYNIHQISAEVLKLTLASRPLFSPSLSLCHSSWKTSGKSVIIFQAAAAGCKGVSLRARQEEYAPAAALRRFMAFNMGTLNQCSDLLYTGRLVFDVS